MRDMNAKCKACGRRAGEHRHGTHECPAGPKHRVVGYTAFGPGTFTLAGAPLGTPLLYGTVTPECNARADEAAQRVAQEKVLRRVGKALVKACKAQAFYCLDCRVTKVDEFGCCAYCGQDVIVESALESAARERRMAHREKPRMHVVGGGA